MVLYVLIMADSILDIVLFETNKIGIAGRLNENAIIYGCKFLSFDLSGFSPCLQSLYP